jgi:hypothetical protein
MPKARVKSQTSSIVNPNATWSGSLESYHPCLLPKKVSKSKKLIAFTATCPKKCKKAF